MADTSYSDMKSADNRGTAVSEVQLRPDGSARIHGWLNQSRRLDYELGPVRPFSYTPDSLLKLSLPGSLGPRLSMAAVKQSITPKAKRRGAPAPPASEDASPGASGLAATLSAVADVLGGAASPFKADPPPRGGAASAASSSSSFLGRAASSLVGLCEPGEHGVGYRFVKAWLPEKDTFLLCHVDGFKHSLEEVSRERAARIYLRHYAGLAEDAVPLLPAAEAEGAEEEAEEGADAEVHVESRRRRRLRGCSSPGTAGAAAEEGAAAQEEEEEEAAEEAAEEEAAAETTETQEQEAEEAAAAASPRGCGGG
mmetsp:Transcript_32548/g.96178  ORF Transcript_32548/g.96178 Transcript_32548/m.96178 type:complete len:311 (-) Transcript_32548:143-1075(-)